MESSKCQIFHKSITIIIFNSPELEWLQSGSIPLQVPHQNQITWDFFLGTHKTQKSQLQTDIQNDQPLWST